MTWAGWAEAGLVMKEAVAKRQGSAGVVMRQGLAGAAKRQGLAAGPEQAAASPQPTNSSPPVWMHATSAKCIASQGSLMMNLESQSRCWISLSASKAFSTLKNMPTYCHEAIRVCSQGRPGSQAWLCHRRA